jgi:hypothetical protein
MKNVYILALMTLLPVTSWAQWLSLQDSQGQPVTNGGTVSVSGMASESLLTLPLTATLNTSTAINVNMRRYEVDVVSGSENYFCWGVCYDAMPSGTLPVWFAGQEAMITMEPGTPVNEFKAYLVPNNTSGISTFRYVWFNTANASDTVSVTVVFQVAPVGIAEVAAPKARIEVFPNPVVDDARLRYAVSHASGTARLVVHNALGSVVHERVLNAHEGEVVLETRAMEPGFYFASVQVNGRALATRRIAVVR